MGQCTPFLRHPHLLRGTICDQPDMSGMSHEPPTGSQQAKDQEPRAKVRPRALTGWKYPRASSPAQQKPWPCSLVAKGEYSAPAGVGDRQVTNL